MDNSVKIQNNIKGLLNKPIPTKEEIKQIEKDLKEKAKLSFSKRNPYQSLLYEYIDIDSWMANKEDGCIFFDARYANIDIMQEDITEILTGKEYTQLIKNKCKWEGDGSVDEIANKICTILNIGITPNNQDGQSQHIKICNLMMNFFNECYEKGISPDRDEEQPQKNLRL